MLKYTFLTLSLTVAALIPNLALAQDKQPNVIYILADDLGYGDLSIYGQEKFNTPNIDSIGHQGIKFTNHYAGNTVCSPSRAVLLTGQSPKKVHVHGNGNELRASLNEDMVTLPRLFKNAGYATGGFGKWGLGFTDADDKQNPLKHGFDTFSGWRNQREAHTYYPDSIVRDGKKIPLEKGAYIHDVIMDDAFKFISDSAKEHTPFFAYLPTAIPHAAMHAPKELHNKWREKLPQFEAVVGKYHIEKRRMAAEVQNPIAAFAAMMEHLDNQVGALLTMLDELGIADTTIIMFTSDNGPHFAGGHDPVFWNSNGNLRGFKRDLYEGGIRSPLLVRWPTKIQPGTSSDHISAFGDMLPTFAEIINQPIPEQSDGISMLNALTNKDADQQDHPYLYWKFVTPNLKLSGHAVRMGDWKIIQTLAQSKKAKVRSTGLVELYNLADDESETKDLAEIHPELTEKMTKILYSKNSKINFTVE